MLVRIAVNNLIEIPVIWNQGTPQKSLATVRLHPQKINIEPENDGFGRWFSSSKLRFHIHPPGSTSFTIILNRERLLSSLT